MWLLTYRCNLSCRHCYVFGSGRRTEVSELSLSERKRVVDELADKGIETIGVLGGEIFLLSNIIELMTYISNKGIKITIETNGTLLTEHICERLAALTNLRAVGVSFEGPSPHMNDMIRGGGCFLQAEKGIALLEQYNIPFFIDVTLSRLNSSYIDAMCEFAIQKGATGIAFGDLIPSGRGKNLKPYLLKPTEEKSCIEKIWAAHKEYQHALHITTNIPFAFLIDPVLIPSEIEEKNIYCGMGRKVILDPTGNILPCQYINDPLGNILSDSWEDIWFSPKMKRYRNVFSLLEGKCSLCKYRLVCGGCRAAALTYTGNLYGEDPRCWHETEE
jgi:radical SAM protein with 4Fe4S-binding SPASM domain